MRFVINISKSLNLKNYDGHLIIQNAEKLSNQKKIDAISPNSEKIISIGFDSLSVKDSFSFITASLDKLVSMTKYDSTHEKKQKQIDIEGKLAKQI